VVVTEAGGRFTNLDGTPGPIGPGAVATNGRLHDEVVAMLTPDPDDDEPDETDETDETDAVPPTTA
jgi:histidinol-phosphatase